MIKFLHPSKEKENTMKILISAFFILFTNVLLNANSSDKSIFINENNEDSKQLKKEFFNKTSKSFSIALSSMNYEKEKLNFILKDDTLGKNILAHLYGKNKNKIRIIHGFYPSYKDALNAISFLDENIQKNKPYVMKMKSFQNFYEKYYPNTINNNIIKLQMKDSISNEKVVKTKLSKDIKIIKPNIQNKKRIKKEIVKKKINKKQKIKKVTKKRIDLNKGKFLKDAGIEDVYYVESSGKFNILSEVFIKDKSSFYTIDIGELRLSKTSIENFFKENNLSNHTLAYKYGDNKEYARIIYGAYEDEKSAQKEISKLDLKERRNLRVSNIQNHQKLYKRFHNNKMKKQETVIYKEIVEEKFISKSVYENEFVYVQKKNEINALKDELFNKASTYYTITLITFDKEDISISSILDTYDLSKDIIAYTLGSRNNYYRVLYGTYSSYYEALEAIDNLDEELKRNKPYVSKIKTNQKKYESYKGKTFDDESVLLRRIELQ